MRVSDPGFKGGDRTEIELPAIQREVLALLKKNGKKTVFVNFSGSAMAIVPETQSCDAICLSPSIKAYNNCRIMKIIR